MKSLTELLTTPTTQLGRASRFLVFQIKLWSHCIRLLERNRAGQQAAALSYYTIFGLVPLTIVVLLIFQSFPGYRDMGERFKQFAYEQLHLTEIEYTQETDGAEETVMLTDQIDQIISRFFGGLDRKSLSILSVVLVIWAALGLLSTIERAFNHIWHVSRGRSFLHRMINYWALLTLGPLLLGVGIYITTQYAAFRDLETTVLSHIAPFVLSYLPSLLAFFLLFFLLPNTKVRPGSALWGAAVAALVWSFAKYGFSTYVTRFIPYSKIYGVVGLIPLSVFWIHITWLIALFGLQLTFTTQHLKTLDAAEIAAARKRDREYFITNDLTVIDVAREIAEAFERREGPMSPEVLWSRLDIPTEFGDLILDRLLEKRLLLKTYEPSVGFVPARAPEHITLAEIAEAVAAAALAQPNLEQHETLGKIVRAQQQFLAKHNLKEILDPGEIATPGLSDVPEAPPDGPPAPPA
jgi:membrane protein